MKALLSITLTLISSISFCQLKSIIIDSETKESIPFVNVWVENKNIGTSSNEKGEFELNVNSDKTIVFSAIGYETKKVSSNTIKNTIELKPQLTKLDEVFITTKKKSKKLAVGKFKKSKINFYFACGRSPWIIARHFKYKKEYDQTPFLNTIKVLTNSKVKNSKFNIRLYNTNEKGEPDGYIYNDNIIGIAKKGKKITEIDISHLNIEFPKKGFFIAIEWLIIDSNKHKYTYKRPNSSKKHSTFYYEPSIGAVPSDTDENSWIFTRGLWNKGRKGKEPIKRYSNKYKLLAIELNLTN